MPKKKKTFTMGRYMRSTEECAASQWCIANDMVITPRQAAWGVNEWYIDIEQGKYPNRRLLGTSLKHLVQERYGKKLHSIKNIIMRNINSEYRTLIAEILNNGKPKMIEPVLVHYQSLVILLSIIWH